MNEALTYTLSGIAGGLLGAVFFGGLWWTVRKGVASPRPALWFLGSALVRMGIVLAGFYWIGRDDWRRLLVALAGFVVARFVVLRLTRTPVAKANGGTKEASHAP